ncbi:hypothetical protein HLB23_21285 [Nocardia uniformis]|uniref:Uncharacterized protein n=1 Tax=Nocardia uniformis TaxID=53432 RepID=A0A849CFZ4_9NOCA|nr:hypothetical protein [Nocardia uniformis]NNH72361.1 hypothetical protein [Nocardia uniformis]
MTSPGSEYEDMPADQGQPPPQGGRAALIGVVVAAAIVAAFAIGFLINRSDDSDNQTPATSTTSTTPNSTTAIPIPPPISPRSIIAPQPTNLKPTAPQPTPQPTAPARDIGDDCSHGNIVAQWGKTPDGQWVCIPQEQGRDEHQVGDDCSHDGIVAQWSWTGAKWVCVPQEQGESEVEPDN